MAGLWRGAPPPQKKRKLTRASHRGRFYGDFFVDTDPAPAPKYTGIYRCGRLGGGPGAVPPVPDARALARFVNNPEKVMGHAALYGLAIMSDSWVMYALALFSQCATFAFIHYVERYGWPPRLMRTCKRLTCSHHWSGPTCATCMATKYGSGPGWSRRCYNACHPS
jgi:hypothetical protein